MGLVFECYVYLVGTDKEREGLNAHFEAKTQVSIVEKKAIIDRFGLPFAFFVASSALIMSRGKNNLPMFYMSLVDEYYGLSNAGFENRAAYKAGLPLKGYKRLKKRELEKYKAKTEAAIKTGLVIGVEDNYNKQYRVTRIDANKPGAFTNANRCVGAVSIIPANIDLTKETEISRPFRESIR